MKILIWKWSDGNKECISVTKQCSIFNSLLICIYYDKFTPFPSLSNIPNFILIVRSKNNLTKIFFYIYRHNKETIKDTIIVEKKQRVKVKKWYSWRCFYGYLHCLVSARDDIDISLSWKNAVLWQIRASKSLVKQVKLEK